MARKAEPTLKKAGESQVAMWLAQLFGVPARDRVQDVLDLINDHHDQFPVMRQGIAFFHWICPVPQYVMSEKINPLVEMLIASEGLPFIVRDDNLSGKSSLWLAQAGDGWLGENLPVRGLTNHFWVDDAWVKVTAIQLETCLRKLRVANQ